LRRRSVGPLDLFSQSISAVAPSAAGATIPVALFAVAGDASLLALVIGFVITSLVVATITQYARRMVTSGSVYSYAAWAGGTRSAAVTGAALLVGALGITLVVLLGAVSAASVLLRFAFPGAASWAMEPVLILVIAGLGLTLFALGVKVSTRVTLIVEAAAILIILTVMGILIVSNWGVHPPVAPTTFDPLALGAGAAVAVGLFVGFETSATLGAEARRPFRDVPRSFVLAVVIAAVIFAISFVGQYAGFNATGMFTPVGDIDPTTSGAPAALVVMLDIGILLSYLAAFVASLNGVIRVIFTLGKDGLLPAGLARVDRRNRLPMPAALVVTSLVTLTALLAVAATGNPQLVVTVGLMASGLGCGLAYAFACLLLPKFRRRIGEPLLIASITAYAVGAIILLALVSYVLWNLAQGSFLVVIPLIGILGVWALVTGFSVRAAGRARVGTYDQSSIEELVPVGVEARFDVGRTTGTRG
jgi:amino acid transporter